MMDLEQAGKTVQVVAVVVGLVISALSFNATRDKENETRRREAARPYLELRQNLYREALKTAALLATPDHRPDTEVAAARKRFRELYVAELSLVEPPEVEGKMIELARQIDPSLLDLTPAQRATYNLAHALRDTFTAEVDLRPAVK